MTRPFLVSILLASLAVGCGDDGSTSFDPPDARSTADVDARVDDPIDARPGSPSIHVDPVALTIAEGASAGLAVTLDAAPASGLDVRVTVSPPGVLSLGASALTFDASNGSRPQVITVTALADDDDDDDRATIRLTAAGAETIEISVVVSDDDRGAVALVVAPAAPTVREGGITRLTARLSGPPATSITVAVQAEDGRRALVTPSTLTFTRDTWQTEQSVAITALNDADAVDNVTAIAFSHAAIGRTAVLLTIADDDTQRVVLSRTTATVREGEATTVDVTLAAQPPGDILVEASSATPAALTATPSTLTFTPTSWNTPQRVTLQTARDTDAAPADIAVRFSSAGLDTASIAVHVDDVDATGILAPATVRLDEGSSSHIAVALTSAPSAPVAVRVESSIPTLLSVAPDVLTFTPANWHVAQVVTVTSKIDVNIVRDIVPVVLRATGIAAKIVDVEITDRQGARLVLTPGALTLAEGERGTFTVALQDRPAGNAIFQIGSTDTTAVVVTPAAIAFTPSNFDRPQTITVVSVPDADAIADVANVTIGLDGQTQASIAVTVPDTIARTIVTSVPSITIAEGARADLEVRLSAPPITTAVVTIVSPDLTAVQAIPRQIAFTRANWNLPQRVAIAAVQDPDVSDRTVTLRLTADDYPEATVDVTVDDDDVQVIQATAGTFRVAEGMSITVAFALRLPFGTATVVTASVDDPNLATVTPAATIIEPERWNEVQQLTITGIRDANQVNDRTTLRLRVEGGAEVVREIEVVDLRQP